MISRAAAESLRKEKFLFLTQTEPYDKDDAFHLLVQRVEALLSKENTDWAQSMMNHLKERSVLEIPDSGRRALLRVFSITKRIERLVWRELS